MSFRAEWRRYWLPVVLVLLALGPTLFLAPILERSTFLLFTAAVVASAFVGGLRSGLIATALAVAFTLWLVEPQTGGWGTRQELLRFGTFLLVSLWVSALSGRMSRFRRQLERRAEDLRRSEERYRRIVDLADEGIWALDAEGRTTYVNRRLTQILGFAHADMLGRFWQDFAEDKSAADEVWRRQAAGETTRQELSFRRKDGEVAWLRCACTPTLEPTFQGAVMMLTDVTQQKRDRETRRESESLLRAVIEGTSEGVFVKDAEGRYLLINPAGASALGRRSAAEVVGRTDAELLPAAAATAVAEQERRVVDESAARTFEYAVPDPSGTRIFSVTATPHRDASGRAIGVIGVSRDITERKRMDEEKAALLADAQRARREAEAANRTKDEFLATLSHELRTPLTSIVGWTKMLRSGQLDPETSVRAIETIDRNARLQTRLIADVLDLSRIVSGKLRLNLSPLELPAIVDAALDIVRPVAEAKGVTLRKAIDAYQCPVSGDADRLQQVVWNLLSNAIKFTPRGGAVEVRLSCQSAEAEIAVSDTGIGISAELLPHVFERFRQGDASSTRSYGGLGLGLAIARHLMELHGGRIEAESPGLGKGATFRLRLPRLQEASPGVTSRERRRAEAERVPPPRAGALHDVTVLVVDDEPDARELVTTILEHNGARVASADSAPQALDLVQRMHPDVLLSDLEMPGESGYALIAKIRRLRPEEGGKVPAAAVTAYARLEDRTRALRAGFQMHVPKPLNPTELVTIVASLAGRLEEAAP
jgi:PAS domain S-box-containing protein